MTNREEGGPEMEDEKAMTGVAATKATTKKALLTGLRNGNLEKAVEKMEADEAAAEEGVLTQELLSSGLGRVGLTANGLSVACLSLSLPVRACARQRRAL